MGGIRRVRRDIPTRLMLDSGVVDRLWSRDDRSPMADVRPIPGRSNIGHRSSLVITTPVSSRSLSDRGIELEQEARTTASDRASYGDCYISLGLVRKPPLLD